MARNPIVLIHGYSDQGASFRVWEQIIEQTQGVPATTLHIANYVSLSNEVTIKDLAEGFDRALHIEAGLNADEDFDAIVHSTGMLVLRSWLATYPVRRSRLKHLIGLAPATFGSPLAHKGRSWLGALLKGNRTLGPDFMQAGDQVLDALELGSAFTWRLAEQDLFGDVPFYGPDNSTPYAFIFCGNTAYQGLRAVANEPGTDGTVRWAGTPLNARKFVLDLTKNPDVGNSPMARAHPQAPPPAGVDIPVYLVEGLNHGTILSAPSPDLIQLVRSALDVDSPADLDAWTTNARAVTAAAQARLAANDRWQQFVVHAVDERGDGITDYNIQLFTRTDAGEEAVEAFDADVHTYSGDASYRCFHVNLSRLEEQNPQLDNVWARIMASSGTPHVLYYGCVPEPAGDEEEQDVGAGEWTATLNLSHLLANQQVRLFYPYTTTLIELRLNREPSPRGEVPNELFVFLADNP